MKYVIVLLLSMCFLSIAGAGGDKLKNPWQSGEAVVIWVPTGLDEDCELMETPEQSGSSYLCTQIINDDDD